MSDAAARILPFKCKSDRGTMDKLQAIRIITKAAMLYKTNLENKKILFLYGVPGDVKKQIASQADTLSSIKGYEAAFQKSNFLHLTGVQIHPEKVKSAAHFYDMCISNRLTEKAFSFPADGSSHQKLDIIESMMSIGKTATMIGDFTDRGPKLYSEKVTGNVFGCMGFVKDSRSGVNVPNTLLKKDVRDVTSVPTNKVFFTFTKAYGDAHYSSIIKGDKGINIDTVIFDPEIEIIIDRSKING